MRRGSRRDGLAHGAAPKVEPSTLNRKRRAVTSNMFSRTSIPQGVRVFPPTETAQRRTVEAQCLTAFPRWGFRLGLADQPAGTVLIHDIPTEARRTLPLDMFERAVAQGDAPWIT